MLSLADGKELLLRLYGVEFPDSLFLLHEFFAALETREAGVCYDALQAGPAGSLQVLALPEARLAQLPPALPMVLHCRFYADVPEFFTCLYGDWGRHWGLLLDDPARGFRGTASYYNDRGGMQVYPSLFAAVLDRVENGVAGLAEAVEDDPDGEAEFLEQLHLLDGFGEKLRRFIREKEIPLDDRRKEVVPSDTGLGLVVPARVREDSERVLERDGRLKPSRTIERAARKALAAAEKGRPVPALGLGRSLWHWGGERHSALAHDLLRRAYEVLDRPALLAVLETHYRHRNLPRVDLLANPNGGVEEQPGARQ